MSKLCAIQRIKVLTISNSEFLTLKLTLLSNFAILAFPLQQQFEQAVICRVQLLNKVWWLALANPKIKGVSWWKRQYYYLK